MSNTDAAVLVLADGTVFAAAPSARWRLRRRRSGLQHRDDRLPGDPHRSVVLPARSSRSPIRTSATPASTPRTSNRARVYAAGLVIRDLPRAASNWRATGRSRRVPAAQQASSASPTSIRASSRASCARRARRTAASWRAMTHDADRRARSNRARKAAFPGLAGMDLAKVVTHRASPTNGPRAAGQLGNGYAARRRGRFHVVAYDYGIKHNILRMLAERGCRVTVVPAQTPARDVLRAEARRRIPVERPGRSRSRATTRSRRSARSSTRPACRCSASASATSSGPRLGREDDEDEVRPPRREPSGEGPRHRAGGDHQPEPRLRRRPGDAARERAADARLAVRRLACRESRAPTGRRSASRATPRRARGRTTSAICSTASRR